MDRSKNSSRKDGISHKIGDHKHQFRRKDLGGSNLLSRITANRGSLLSHHNYKIRIGWKNFWWIIGTGKVQSITILLSHRAQSIS